MKIVRRKLRSPGMQISPMIDMMFLMLIFFIFSTMYMVQMKTVPVKLPAAQNAITAAKTSFVVSLKTASQDGKGPVKLYLGEKETDLATLITQASLEVKRTPDMAVIIRAEKSIEYGAVMEVLDKLKGAGITRIAMAVERGAVKP